MNNHLVLVEEKELEEIISGERKYLLRFFKRVEDFIKILKKGDFIYLRSKKGEVKARFSVSKLIIIENAEKDEYQLVRNFSRISEAEFSKNLELNHIVLVVRIEKLEQFITSPVDTPKRTKEWVVLSE